MARGGARPGAGRPRKQEKYAAPIAAAEDRIADHLPRLIDNLLHLAHGWEQVEERYEVARDRDPQELVLVARIVRRAAPDRKANEYLIDRLMGRPTAKVEADLEASDDGVLSRFLEAVARIYGSDG